MHLPFPLGFSQITRKNGHSNIPLANELFRDDPYWTHIESVFQVSSKTFMLAWQKSPKSRPLRRSSAAIKSAATKAIRHDCIVS